MEFTREQEERVARSFFLFSHAILGYSRRLPVGQTFTPLEGRVGTHRINSHSGDRGSGEFPQLGFVGRRT